ncbi:hypothetical protein [Halobacillus amylolyticus]|uniref:DNA-binding protein n=1 Tax=Halobacillus amylolyticus TaxID=2932259 RepID=A0ABY4HDA1_9BACI|nr:hypothetical protein [Halobacillus amylolyticus]UOR12786.1 hypothetical protein MUO15_04530 [Halobacillus amylolyticus]
MRQITISLSLIILGVCIFAGAWMVSSAINNSASFQKGLEQVNVNTKSEEQLMGHLELKEYLGVSGKQLEKILPKKDGNVTKSKIPYIKIGYEYYFLVKAIDKWLTETEAETFR